MTDKPHPHKKLYEAYSVAADLMLELTPDDRVALMDWIEDFYCRKCGHFAPEAGNECSHCKLENGE